MNTPNKGILAFYLVTFFGSNLGALATYLSVASIFNSTGFLATVLALRTVCQFLISFITPHLFSSIGIRKSLIVGEVFGIITIILLTTGINFRIPTLVLFSASVLALPAGILQQGIMANLKFVNKEEKDFSRVTGIVNKSIGAIDFFSCLAIPMLLTIFPLSVIYLFDIFTYLIGLTILLLSSEFKIGENIENIRRVSPLELFKFSICKNNFLWFLSLAGPMMIIGFVPLVAGSGDAIESIDPGLGDEVRFLFLVEAVSLFISGTHTLNFLKQKMVYFIYSMSGVLFCFFVLYPNTYSFFLSILLVNVCYASIFRYKRDSFISSNSLKGNEDTYLAVSFSSVCQSIYMAFSPLVLGLLVFDIEFSIFVFYLVLFQLVVYFFFGRQTFPER